MYGVSRFHATLVHEDGCTEGFFGHFGAAQPAVNTTSYCLIRLLW